MEKGKGYIGKSLRETMSICQLNSSKENFRSLYSLNVLDSLPNNLISLLIGIV